MFEAYGIAGWATAASAESMQIPYQCEACPECWCATGEAQSAAGNSNAAAGCGACFQLTSTGTNPYGAAQPRVTFNIAIADSCPNAVNSEWCPAQVGQVNAHGYQYHFDLYAPDVARLGVGNNPIVSFERIACPANVMAVMQASCCNIWYRGQGCANICGGGYTCP